MSNVALDTLAQRDIARVMGDPPIAPGEDFLTISEVAKWLSYDRLTIWRWVRAGILPAQRLPHGRRWLIRRSDVERLLTAGGEDER